MQFKVPQDVQQADKIIGPLSLAQLIMVVVGAGIAYSIFTVLNKQGLPIVIWLPPVAIVAIITVCFAFVKIANLPFYRYLALLIERIVTPSKRVWVKGADHIEVDSEFVSQEDKKKKEKKKKKENVIAEKEKKLANIGKLTSSLDMLNEEKEQKAEAESTEEGGLENVDNADDDDLIGAAFLDKKAKEEAQKPMEPAADSPEDKIMALSSQPKSELPDKIAAAKESKSTDATKQQKAEASEKKTEASPEKTEMAAAEDAEPKKKRRRRRRRRKKKATAVEAAPAPQAPQPKPEAVAQAAPSAPEPKAAPQPVANPQPEPQPVVQSAPPAPEPAPQPAAAASPEPQKPAPNSADWLNQAATQQPAAPVAAEQTTPAIQTPPAPAVAPAPQPAAPITQPEAQPAAQAPEAPAAPAPEAVTPAAPEGNVPAKQSDSFSAEDLKEGQVIDFSKQNQANNSQQPQQAA